MYKITSSIQETPNYFILPLDPIIREPQWSRKWKKQIDLNLLIDGNGNLIDTVPFYKWTSPTLLDIDKSDPVMTYRVYPIINADTRVELDCGEHKWNNDNSFTI